MIPKSTDLKVVEVAARCRVSVNTVWLWIRRGELETYRLGEHGTYRVSREALAKFLNVDVADLNEELDR